MRRRLLIIAWLLALTACGGQAATPTAAPTATASATATAPPTSTATAVPTATATPTVTPTRTPTPLPTATATRTATATPTPIPDYTIRDGSGLCQATIPGAFRDDGGIWRVGDEAGVTLVGTTAGFLLDFDTATQLLMANIGTQIGDYRETGRTREASDRLRITYTGNVLGVPGSGIIYQQQFDQTICAVILFAATGQETRYASAFERIIASLGPVR